jgi:hypothetical protein
MSDHYCGPCMRCGKNGIAPCSDLDYNSVLKDRLYRISGMPTRTTWTSGPMPQSMGCICPPTSEQTCMNPLCPRKPIGKANDVS